MDVCAIANYLYQTSGQGYLIIGTANGGNPIGLNPSNYSETRIQQIISSRTDPPPTFAVHHVNYSGVDLLIIKLRRNTSGPHQLKRNSRPSGFPIRRGSTTGMMTTNEVFLPQLSAMLNNKIIYEIAVQFLKVTYQRRLVKFYGCSSNLPFQFNS